MLPPHITLQWQPLVLREPPNQWQLFFFHFHYSWCIHITLLITGRQPLQFFERSQGKSPHLRLKLVQLFFLMAKSHPWMLRHLSHVIKKKFSCWKEKKYLYILTRVIPSRWPASKQRPNFSYFTYACPTLVACPVRVYVVRVKVVPHSPLEFHSRTQTFLTQN